MNSIYIWLRERWKVPKDLIICGNFDIACYFDKFERDKIESILNLLNERSTVTMVIMMKYVRLVLKLKA